MFQFGKLAIQSTVSALGTVAIAAQAMINILESVNGIVGVEMMMIAITIVKPLTWALSFVPAYGMRAAGDVKFSMIVATLTMWLCRVALAVYLCRVWGFGPIAVWIGMFADWIIRGSIFTSRFLSGKWAEKQIV